MAMTRAAKRRTQRWKGVATMPVALLVVAGAVAASWVTPETADGAQKGCGPHPDSIAVTVKMNVSGTTVEDDGITTKVTRNVSASLTANLVPEYKGTYRASAKGSTAQAAGSFSHETDQQYHKVPVHNTYVARSSSLVSPPNLSLYVSDVDGPCVFKMHYAPSFDKVAWKTTETSGATSQAKSGSRTDAWGSVTLEGPLTDFRGHAEISGTAKAGSNRLTTEAGELSGVPPPYTGSATVVIGAAAPMVKTELGVDHLDVPSLTRWVEVPTEGTHDGNIVRLSAKVENPGGPASAEIDIFDRTTGEVIVPKTRVTLEKGTNTFEFPWDTLDRAWSDDGSRAEAPVLVLTALVDGVPGTDAKPVPVLPKPVVLVHGWNATADGWSSYPGFLKSVDGDWKGFAVGDGTYPGTMDTGSIAKPWYAGKNLYQNARELDTYVAALRDDLNVQQVDIVAHSMGGLIARRYLGAHMPVPGGVPAVARLLQLGTPNLGSICADTLPNLSAIPLRPAMAERFNRANTATNGTHLAIMAGDPLGFTCIGGGPGDGVVEVSSAFGLPAIKDRMRVGSIHTEMTGDRGNFDDFVRPRLTGGTGGSTGAKGDGRPPSSGAKAAGPAPGATAARAESAAPPSDLRALAAGTVTVAPGATADVRFLVDDLDRIGATLLAAPGITAQLIAPTTTSTETDAPATTRTSPARAALRRTSADHAELWSTDQVDDPEPGAWRLRLSSDVGDPVVVTYALAGIGGGPALVLELPDADKGGRVTATARLARDGVPFDGKVTGRIHEGRPTPREVPFRDDGRGGDAVAADGRFTATFDGSSDAQHILVVSAVDAEATLERSSLAVFGRPAQEPAPKVRSDGALPVFAAVGERSARVPASVPRPASGKVSLIAVPVILVVGAASIGSWVVVRRRRLRA